MTVKGFWNDADGVTTTDFAAISVIVTWIFLTPYLIWLAARMGDVSPALLEIYQSVSQCLMSVIAGYAISYGLGYRRNGGYSNGTTI